MERELIYPYVFLFCFNFTFIFMMFHSFIAYGKADVLSSREPERQHSFARSAEKFKLKLLEEPFLFSCFLKPDPRFQTALEHRMDSVGLRVIMVKLMVWMARRPLRSIDDGKRYTRYFTLRHEIPTRERSFHLRGAHCPLVVQFLVLGIFAFVSCRPIKAQSAL